MQELLLIVTYTAQAGMGEQFVREVTASGILEQIRAEDGCLGYTYYCDAGNADEVVLIERWASEGQQETHMAQPHMQALMAIKNRYVTDTKVRRLHPCD